jgi:hypothetical protein
MPHVWRDRAATEPTSVSKVHANSCNAMKMFICLFFSCSVFPQVAKVEFDNFLKLQARYL